MTARLRQVGTVGGLWRYPVKSMAGEPLGSAIIRPAQGLEGDRIWALRDEERGEITNGKKLPALMQIAAELQEEGGGRPRARIRFPDGRAMFSDDRLIDPALTARLGRRVSIQPLRPATDQAFYRSHRRPTRAETKFLLGVPADAPMPDLSDMPIAMMRTSAEYVTPPGTFVDAAAIHLITSASLDAIAAAGGCEAHVGRFRPNILVQSTSSDHGFIEANWCGGELLIGTLVFDIVVQTLRCTMPGQVQPGLDANPKLLVALREVSGQRLGVYLEPKTTGEVRVGDPVFLRPSEPLSLSAAATSPTQHPKAAEVSKPASRPRTAEPVEAKPALLPPGYRPLRVIERHDQTSFITSFTLADPAGHPLPPALPGQHCVIAISDGADESPLFRSYSLSRWSKGDSYVLTVLRQGTVSSLLHGELQVGDHLQLLGPRGAFVLYPADPTPAVFAATGIGITPMIAMLEAIALENPDRPVRLLYGTRDSKATAFSAEIADIASRLTDFRLVRCFSRPGEMDRLGISHEMTGRIDGSHLLALADGLRDPDYFLCGQAAFIRDAMDTLTTAGVSHLRVHHELFGPAHLSKSTADAHATFNVQFKRSRRQALWTGSQQNLLEFAEAQGLPAPSGCRYGACQACALTLLEGRVQHADGIQPPPEANRFLACCAHPASDLIIDL